MAEELKVLFRDSSIVCCVKEPGVLSEDPGLPQMIRNSLGVPEVFCVHRLDRETGGIMVYALSREVASALSSSFSPGGDAEKIYLAAVSGVLQEKSGTLTDLLFHDSSRNRSYIVDRVRKGVREASLSYEVLTESDDRSLIRVRLHSGRTHQIRVQFAGRRHPVLGDRRYGSSENCPLALWAYGLSFRHPVSGKELSFSCPPPCSGAWEAFFDAGDLSETPLTGH